MVGETNYSYDRAPSWTSKKGGGEQEVIGKVPLVPTVKP